MQVFVTISNIGMMVNACVNVKNWLIKLYVVRDIFGILVIVNVNVINHLILENIQTMKIVNVEKKVSDKLVEERSKNIEKVKIAEEKNKCHSCILYIVLF